MYANISKMVLRNANAYADWFRYLCPKLQLSMPAHMNEGDSLFFLGTFNDSGSSEAKLEFM